MDECDRLYFHMYSIDVNLIRADRQIFDYFTDFSPDIPYQRDILLHITSIPYCQWKENTNTNKQTILVNVISNNMDIGQSKH